MTTESGWHHAEGDPPDTLRWWDGTAWTDHVSAQPPAPPAAPAARPSSPGGRRWWIVGAVAVVLVVGVAAAFALADDDGDEGADPDDVSTTVARDEPLAPGCARPESEDLTLDRLEVPIVDVTIEPLTLQQERDIGADVHRDVLTQFGELDSPADLARVREIVDRIVPFTDRPGLGYTVTLLATDDINAFAVPGGFVYVTRGLLDFVGGDEELAGILGHELAHISLHHGSRVAQLELATIATLELALDSGIDIADLFDTRDEDVAQGVALVLSSGWTQGQELDADGFGIYYAAKAGYDPGEIVAFFERLESISPTADDPLAALFQTHPPNPQRISEVRRQIAEYCL